ncbi:MAG TPA: tetratricopeptide repeat protein [Tepidisphaeraceae bacterium]|jgi:predicted O-linked N-acetylglucosamine transferase (SPINDLY family)
MKEPTSNSDFELAVRLHREGRLPEAEQLYRQILARQPDRPEVLHALGALLDGLGRPREAVQCIEQSIARAPGVPEAHYHLARAFKKLGELNGAIREYKEAVRLRTQFVEAWNNLGVALKDANQIDEAMLAYRKAIALRPNDAEPRFNLGNALASVGNAGEAIEAYRFVLSNHPDAADVLGALGNALRDCGELDAAIDCYRRSIAIAPDPRVGSNLAYTTYLLPSASPVEILKEHKRWDQTYARQLEAEIIPFTNDRSPDRRLRVGYVSHDLSFHPVGRFMLPLLEKHNRDVCEIVCYADGPSDEMTGRIKSNIELWRQTAGMSDAQLAEQIRRDSIDVLVDLSMHTKGNRLLAFARKPAPVQVAYLAYCGTTGVATMDYRLTDPYLDPPGSGDEYYSERSVRLAKTYWCYQPLKNLPEVGPSPVMTAGHLTFGSLNTFAKVTEPAIRAWGRILREIPRSLLVIQSPLGPHRQRVQDTFKAEGVDSDRVEFSNRLPMDDYFKLYQRIDLTLDSSPCSGATTTCDSLWMGAPVVSLLGATAMCRSGASILANAGLGEFVARDVDDYVRIATDLSGDLSRLAQLRATLRERMTSSPLMDAKQFAADVEAAFRTMWRAWCAGAGAGR